MDFWCVTTLWFNKAMAEEQPTFKVTDRRLFNADGSPRDISPEEKPEPPPVQQVTTQEAAAPARAAEPAANPEPEPEIRASADETPAEAEEEFSEEDLADARDPASFVSFVMSIASNAASALGM